MISAVQIALFASLMAIVLSAPGEQVVSCSASEHQEMPCVCCKKDCWYAIASAATHELGHMPGEAGEQEALATLKLIRACMMSECSRFCMARTRPF